MANQLVIGRPVAVKGARIALGAGPVRETPLPLLKGTKILSGKNAEIVAISHKQRRTRYETERRKAWFWHRPPEEVDTEPDVTTTKGRALTMIANRIVFPGRPTLARLLLLVLLAAVASCGGDGATPPAPLPPPPPPPPVAPVQVGTIPNQALATGQSATLEVSSYFRDPDGGALTYTAASSAAGVVSVSLSGSTLTMVGVADGTATVTVTARDPGGLTAAQGFQVTVATPNRAPEAVGTIPNQSVAVGQTVTLAVSSYFRDPDGDALTYTAASSAAAVISVSLSGSTLTMVGVADGTGTVTVTARDPDGLTAMQNLQVTVETPNKAPEAVGTIPNQTVEAGSASSVDVSSYFRDADGDRLTYTAATSNAAVATTAVSGSQVTVSAVAAGTATVTVTARDPGGLTAAQGFQVTVGTSNRAPEAVGTIPTATVATGGTASVDVSSYFRDPDGDRLTYAARSSNAAVATVAVSTSRVTISAVAAGTATVTVTARDPGGLMGTQSFGVTVRGGGGGGAGFRDDFDSSASLGDWEIRNGSAAVANGILRLTRTSSTSLGVAERRLEAPLTDWTIRARLGGSDGDDGLVGVWWRTGNAGYPSAALTLGTFQTANYVVWIFDAAQSEWITFQELNGNSRAVRTGTSEFTNVAVDFKDGTLVVSAGDTELINLTLPADNPFRPVFASVQSIRLVSEDARGSTASFDWVEVTGDGGGGGGGGAAPDLVVSLSPPNVTVAPSGTFSYDVTVRNQGDGSSAATQGRVLISENSRITTNDREIGQYDVPSLDPSGEASGSRRLTVGSNPGTIYLGHCVDVVAGESDTGNNCSSAVTVTIESGGGGGDACTVGLVLSPGESCTFSGGTFEVLSNGCVRVGSVSGICGRNININGLRATRLSGNRWEILGLPGGDADDNGDLTVTSVSDLAETSEVKNGAVGLTIKTLGIRRKR